MALRQLLSKAFLPSFERDLARSMTAEVESANAMVDCFLAPQVFSYKKATSAGAFQSTHMRQSPESSERVVKVHYPVQGEGLFQDRDSFHHR